MAYIEVKNEYKRYQMGETTITANDGISFEVEKGEVAVILGPSGAGKSTVLNILGGMDSCDEGEIIIDGTDIAQFSEKQLTTYRRNDVGFVFQFNGKRKCRIGFANRCGCVGFDQCFTIGGFRGTFR